MAQEGTSKVLVIDDSAAARASICRVLEAQGFEVLALPSAIGATRLILRFGIDAVVVDLSMPGLSGDRLVGVLRKNSRLEDLVVVVVSGQESQQLSRIAEEIDVQGVLGKDDVEAQLAPMLRRLLSNRRTAAIQSGARR